MLCESQCCVSRNVSCCTTVASSRHSSLLFPAGRRAETGRVEDEYSHDSKGQSLTTEQKQLLLFWFTDFSLSRQCYVRLSDVPTAVEWLHKAYNSPTTIPEVSRFAQ